jgi:uncharacterized protein
MNKVKINVLGLSYSQTQSGAYALILAEENGERRVPIIIGGLEAQAIAIELEGLKPPRPLTHDLFYKCLTTFNIDLIEVNIYKIEEGIFYSNLVLDNGTDKIKIDARTSDAIAIALRFKSPIYTTEEILTKVGIVLSNDKETKEKEKVEKKSSNPKSEKKSDFSALDIDALNTLLEESVRNEDYEKASKIRDELKKREKK